MTARGERVSQQSLASGRKILFPHPGAEGERPPKALSTRAESELRGDNSTLSSNYIDVMMIDIYIYIHRIEKLGQMGHLSWGELHT